MSNTTSLLPYPAAAETLRIVCQLSADAAWHPGCRINHEAMGLAGVGPEFQKSGPHRLYTPERLDVWVEQRLTPVVASPRTAALAATQQLKGLTPYIPRRASRAAPPSTGPKRTLFALQAACNIPSRTNRIQALTAQVFPAVSRALRCDSRRRWPMTDMLRVILRPAFNRHGARLHGKFVVTLDGRQLCISRQPLLDAARVLIKEGVDPATPIATRHAGADFDAMTSTVGAAAKWTVEENEIVTDLRPLVGLSRLPGPLVHASKRAAGTITPCLMPNASTTPMGCRHEQARQRQVRTAPAATSTRRRWLLRCR